MIDGVDLIAPLLVYRIARKNLSNSNIFMFGSSLEQVAYSSLAVARLLTMSESTM